MAQSRDLSMLIEENNLPAIKELIQKLKSNHRGYFTYDDEEMIAPVVRDAILLNRMDIVRYFIEVEKFKADALAPIDDQNPDKKKRLIYFAVKIGSLSTVKLLVAHHADLEWFDGFGYGLGNNDAIEAVLQTGSTEIAEYLFTNGADPNGTKQFGYKDIDTYLGIAASRLDYSMADTLIKFGADIEKALYFHSQHLRKRSHETNMNHESIQFLLDYSMGVNLHSDTVWSRTFDNLSFLADVNIANFNFMGVSFDGKPINEAMLKHKNLVNFDKAITTENDLERLENPQRKIILKRNLATAFAKQGKLIEECKENQKQLINLVSIGEAIKRGDIAAVNSRLQAGISPNIKYNFTYKYDDAGKPLESSLLYIAVFYGHKEIIELLVNHPAHDKANFPEAIELANQLHLNEIYQYLCSKQDVDQQNEECIEKKCDLNLSNNNKETALMVVAGKRQNRNTPYATRKGVEESLSKQDIEIIKLLLEAKADATIGTKNNALNLAAQSGSLEAMQLLMPVTPKKEYLYHVLDCEAENRRWVYKAYPWYVPLMFDAAGSIHWLEILKLLENEGADLTHENKDGSTLIFVLMNDTFLKYNDEILLRHFKLLTYLLNNGADPHAKRCDGVTAIELHEQLKLKLKLSDETVLEISGRNKTPEMKSVAKIEDLSHPIKRIQDPTLSSHPDSFLNKSRIVKKRPEVALKKKSLLQCTLL
jgi:ankyrin repeat protein